MQPKSNNTMCHQRKFVKEDTSLDNCHLPNHLFLNHSYKCPTNMFSHITILFMKQTFGYQETCQPKSHSPPPLCYESDPDILPNKTSFCGKQAFYA